MTITTSSVDTATRIGWLSRVWGVVGRHPYRSGLVLAAIVVGAATGALVPIGELGAVRRVIGGAVAGLSFSLFPLGYRLFD